MDIENIKKELQIAKENFKLLYDKYICALKQIENLHDELKSIKKIDFQGVWIKTEFDSFVNCETCAIIYVKESRDVYFLVILHREKELVLFKHKNKEFLLIKAEEFLKKHYVVDEMSLQD
jgi:hypothetical protein